MTALDEFELLAIKHEWRTIRPERVPAVSRTQPSQITIDERPDEVPPIGDPDHPLVRRWPNPEIELIPVAPEVA